jgi:hypothetical protein
MKEKIQYIAVCVKKMLTNNVFLTLVSLALFVIGVWLSIEKHDFLWLSRFGALIISTGIIVLARPAILGKDIDSDAIYPETGLSFMDPNHYKKTGEPYPEWVKENVHSRTAVGWLGPLLCLIGTGTNGFADLLNKCFGY